MPTTTQLYDEIFAILVYFRINLLSVQLYFLHFLGQPNISLFTRSTSHHVRTLLPACWFGVFLLNEIIGSFPALRVPSIEPCPRRLHACTYPPSARVNITQRKKYRDWFVEAVWF